MSELGIIRHARSGLTLFGIVRIMNELANPAWLSARP